MENSLLFKLEALTKVRQEIENTSPFFKYISKIENSQNFELVFKELEKSEDFMQLMNEKCDSPIKTLYPLIYAFQFSKNKNNEFEKILALGKYKYSEQEFVAESPFMQRSICELVIYLTYHDLINFIDFKLFFGIFCRWVDASCPSSCPKLSSEPIEGWSREDDNRIFNLMVLIDFSDSQKLKGVSGYEDKLGKLLQVVGFLRNKNQKINFEVRLRILHRFISLISEMIKSKKNQCRALQVGLDGRQFDDLLDFLVITGSSKETQVRSINDLLERVKSLYFEYVLFHSESSCLIRSSTCFKNSKLEMSKSGLEFFMLSLKHIYAEVEANSLRIINQLLPSTFVSLSFFVKSSNSLSIFDHLNNHQVFLSSEATVQHFLLNHLNRKDLVTKEICLHTLSSNAKNSKTHFLETFPNQGCDLLSAGPHLPGH